MQKLDGKFSIDGERIVNTVTGEAIPDDEPLFILRGRDRLAILALREYWSLCERDHCLKSHIQGVEERIDAFLQFSMKQFRMKQPGSSGDRQAKALDSARAVLSDDASSDECKEIARELLRRSGKQAGPEDLK